MAVTAPDPRYTADGARRYARGIRQRRLSRWLELSALRRALRGAGGSVLDAPCGTGRVDALLRERFAVVTGLDRSADMLGVYLAADPRRRALCADLFDAPLPDRGFDWVVCHRLFHHLQDDAARLALLGSLRRLARDGIALYLWLDGPLNRRRRSWRRSISPAQFRALAARAGLEIVRVHRCAWPFQPKAVAVLRPVPGVCG